MNIDEIGKIAKLMKDYELTQFSLESEDMRLKMKRGLKPVSVQPAVPAQATVPVSQPAVAEQAEGAEPAAPEQTCETIDSPIVGTFYRSPAPDAKAFVEEGDEVGDDTVVCIVEAMKVMNEIKAETNGKIRKVLIENGSPVEFGQPMFEIEPV